MTTHSFTTKCVAYMCLEAVMKVKGHINQAIKFVPPVPTASLTVLTDCAVS